ncbi:hypothetical protein [Terracidiphilus sp.]|jgi:hypothetical protein|uniref:hypothetical protein n=1 Tax=Terracidiphilus sp. TaxID=1964191 RepID=UPI003C263F06
MTVQAAGPARGRHIQKGFIALAAVATLAFPLSLSAQDFGFPFPQFPQLFPGNLVVSRSLYDNQAGNVSVGEALPPECAPSTGACVTAVNNGTYPFVFNNAPVDASFGITSRIFLDQITPFGLRLNTLEVPNSLDRGITSSSNQMVTSFSSKSEIGLNLSLDGNYLTFMGYNAPVNAVDVSNSNTPLAVDPTNPVGTSFFRVVARLDQFGRFTFTETNAYSGNNGRAAILNNLDGKNLIYAAGNAGNGSNPQPLEVDLGAGAQLIDLSNEAESEQNPPLPSPLGSFSVTQLGDPADKIGKDDNFRGLTVYNNVVYTTKGSGSNGVNTVYFIDTTGTACPNGTGVPSPEAKLPADPLSFVSSTVTKDGLPSNMCILSGFPTLSNKAKGANPVNFPFGVWFASPTTLYVADEGDGSTSGVDTAFYTHAAQQTNAGLEKWVLDESSNTWKMVYALTNGLNLGTPYTVPGYPTGLNVGSANASNPDGLPWSPATDGLRNLTGQVNPDGTVTIWAITSTVSGAGDTGADPNKLVVITDKASATTAAEAAHERFLTLQGAGFGEVLRGVSWTPGTRLTNIPNAGHNGFGQ